MHAFRRSHWASWMFDVDSVSDDRIVFGKGGYQGCRGGPGQDWFIENVLELLDAAGEHFIDEETKTLYYQPNATTGSPPSDFDASVPMIQALVVGNATQASPIKNLTLRGLGFRDTAPTYMEPHGVPSGGDWGLERRAHTLRLSVCLSVAVAHLYGVGDGSWCAVLRRNYWPDHRRLPVRTFRRQRVNAVWLPSWCCCHRLAL